MFQYFSKPTRPAHVSTFGILSGNREKRVFKASPGRETMHRRKNRQTASTKWGLDEGEEKCGKHSSRFVRVRTVQTQKIKSLRTFFCRGRSVGFFRRRKNRKFKIYRRPGGPRGTGDSWTRHHWEIEYKKRRQKAVMKYLKNYRSGSAADWKWRRSA